MKIFSQSGFALQLIVLFVGLIVMSAFLPTKWKKTSTWQSLSSPGPLSSAHAFLKENCIACHTPNKGVQGINCIVCHANNAALIQRQATAFHADITTCSPCHLEHSGALAPTRMDHSALARIGLSQLEQVNASDPESRRIRQLMNGDKSLPSNENVTAAEAILKCASCHAVKDRHQGYFGNECASCHAVAKWTIPEFRHPSPNSQECDQCHKAPPSHSMMHFKMISAAVAKQPSAKVNQCYKCHQTTVWNDIRGVGWYKHH